MTGADIQTAAARRIAARLRQSFDTATSHGLTVVARDGGVVIVDERGRTLAWVTGPDDQGGRNP